MSERKREQEGDLIALGHALRELRLRAGLTQEAVALRAGMHPAYVSRLERGHRGVQWLTVRRLLVALEVDLSQLAEAVERAERD
jgi:transcriptional regulator with XRE-family HTH domain